MTEETKIYKDDLGYVLEISDIVVYGKSNRNYPMNIGEVKGFKEYDNYTEVIVLGKGHSKVGNIGLNNRYFGPRVIKLPDSHKQHLVE